MGSTLSPEMDTYLADLDPGRALAAVVDVYLTDPVGIGTRALTSAVRAFREAEAESR